MVESTASHIGAHGYCWEYFRVRVHRYAEYQLKHLLLTGQCIDDKRHPVQGLQLVLENLQHPHFQDSLVMQNLGYFQLKALPGVWSLRLADGRHSDIYAIVDRKQTNKAEVEALTVSIDSFDGASLEPLEVRKRPEKANWNLLDDDEFNPDGDSGGGGLFSTLRGAFGMRSQAKKAVEEPEVINVFSVASGHLYERFYKIMILSVRATARR